MTRYVAIVENAGPDQAIGVWFPDLPGCFSGGDDVDAALCNAGEALSLDADALAQEGRALPAPRSVSQLRDDPAVAPDLKDSRGCFDRAACWAHAAEYGERWAALTAAQEAPNLAQPLRSIRAAC